MASRPTRQTTRFDRYELLDKVGEGGYGTVYRARHRYLEKIFALKVLPPALRADEEAMARFEREVKALRRLDHPNVVAVHDAGVEERSGAPYIAMTFVEGETLHHYLERSGALPIDDVVRIGRQMAEALHHVHTRDPEEPLVHRDVKPSNIILTPDGRAVLTDFGIAFSEALPRISREVIGTPEFMSPEQADGRPLDGRSDVYSLGIVLYECLTGRVPFEAADTSPAATARLLGRVLDEAPEPADTHRRDAPPWLVAVVQRCLEKDPADRYPTAAVLAEALRTGDPDPALDAGATDVVPAAVPPARAGTASAAAGRPTRRSPRAAQRPAEATPPASPQRRWRVAAVSAVVVLLAAVAAFGWPDGGGEEADPEAERTAALFQQASAAFEDDRLTTPRGSSSYDFIQQILAVDPDHEDARDLRERIVARYEAWGDEERDAGDYAEALRYYDRALAVAPDTTAALAEKRGAMTAAVAEQQRDASAEKARRPPRRANPKKARERLGW